MSANPTDRACVLWMELDGEIYSPAMSLGRATQETIERDIWNGAHAGVCHAVYSYGSFANGGSYCREITREVAERLGRMSLASSGKPAASALAFLEMFGVGHCDAGAAAPARSDDRPVFAQMPAGSAAKRPPARKRRAKVLSPEELRAQPQFKLPIAGGKQDVAPSSTRIETEEEADVEVLSLKDTRPLAEIEAGWTRFDQKLREMGIKLPKDEKTAVPEPLRAAKAS
ncbi:hypothetical protein SAMN05444161_5364 [Rhizobiales bacterium GAS191]|nr:hypothetical protein SAMN05444161_5364 [Rhizobiales bacterium GAS191]